MTRLILMAMLVLCSITISGCEGDTFITNNVGGDQNQGDQSTDNNPTEVEE